MTVFIALTIIYVFCGALITFLLSATNFDDLPRALLHHNNFVLGTIAFFFWPAILIKMFCGIIRYTVEF